MDNVEHGLIQLDQQISQLARSTDRQFSQLERSADRRACSLESQIEHLRSNLDLLESKLFLVFCAVGFLAFIIIIGLASKK